jgi:hypothetical protein
VAASQKKVKKTMTIFGAILFASFILTSCGPKKNDYPADVIQNFMNSCQSTSDGEQNPLFMDMRQSMVILKKI